MDMDSTIAIVECQNTYTSNGIIQKCHKLAKMNSNLVHASFVVQRETLQQLDAKRPKYFSRSKYIQKIFDEHLSALESRNNQNGK